MASFAPWGLGSLAGGLVAARRGGGAHRAAGLARILAALALGHAALAVTTTSLMAMGPMLLVAGVAIAPAYATINAMADQAAPEGTVTEAFAWLSTAVVSGTSAGTAAAGVLAQNAGPGAAFVLAGLAGALAVAITMRRSRTVNRQVVTTLTPQSRSAPARATSLRPPACRWSSLTSAQEGGHLSTDFPADEMRVGCSR